MGDMQTINNQEPLAQKLQSAIAYLETILELYQRNESALKLAEQLQAVIGVIHEAVPKYPAENLFSNPKEYLRIERQRSSFG